MTTNLYECSDETFIAWFLAQLDFHDLEKIYLIKNTYASHHPRFKKILPKYLKRSDPLQKIALFKLCFLLGYTPKLNLENYAIWLNTYHDLLKDNALPQNNFTSSRLFEYGFDGFGYLQKSGAHNFNQYQIYQKIMPQLSAYTSIPGQLNKISRFQELTEHSDYIASFLAHLNNHVAYHETCGIELGNYACALVLLFDQRYQTWVLDKAIKQLWYIFQEKPDTAIFNRYTQTIIKKIGPDIFSAEALSLVKHIDQLERSKINA